MPQNSRCGSVCVRRYDSEIDDLTGFGRRVDVDGNATFAGKQVTMHILDRDRVVARRQGCKQGASGIERHRHQHRLAIRRVERNRSAGDEVFVAAENAVCVHIEKEIDKDGIRRDLLTGDDRRFGQIGGQLRQ